MSPFNHNPLYVEHLKSISKISREIKGNNTRINSIISLLTRERRGENEYGMKVHYSPDEEYKTCLKSEYDRLRGIENSYKRSHAEIAYQLAKLAVEDKDIDNNDCETEMMSLRKFISRYEQLNGNVNYLDDTKPALRAIMDIDNKDM